MGSPSPFPRVKEIRTFIIEGVGSGGDYHNVRTRPSIVPFHQANPSYTYMK